MTRPLRRCLAAALLCSLLVAVLPAQEAAGRQAVVAVLAVANRSGDPRYDYLEGLLQGLLLFDLSQSRRVSLVERAALEQVLKEQELRLSGLADTQAARVGKLLGADWLLKADYVFLGEDVLLNASLIEVASGRAVAFNERGSTENLVHALCERVVERLTGEKLTLRSANNRSIISLRDETPGAIALHTILLDAEIFVDEGFVGYSTGDVRVPFEITGLRPGAHKVRLHLSSFGVVKLPEVTFHDWEVEVVVKPGQRQVVRSDARHFNDVLYKLIRLLDGEIKVAVADAGKPVSRSHDASFTDREGRRVPIKVSVETARPGSGSTAPTGSAAPLEANVVLGYDGNEQRYRLRSMAGKETELSEKVGKVELQLSIDARYEGRFEVDYSLTRTDIEQNMW
jgi:TolB-like protein